MSRLNRITLVATLATTGLALSGCANAAPAAEPATESAYPVTVTNCGFDVTFDAAPHRVVTIKSNTLELLLALGLGDTVVGSAFSDGPVPDQWAAEAANIPVLSEKVPGQEATLGLEPDLVYAGWESNFSAEGAGERDSLASLGVNTYVSPAACKGDAMPHPLTFDTVFDEFDEVGRIFDVPDASADLIAQQRDALDAITPLDGDTTAVWFSSGSDTPYVGAGIGAPNMIMEAAGLTNLVGDVDDTWTSLGLESIIDMNPDVFVLVDASWNTAESKIALLESNPATAALPAVANKQFVIVDFAETEAGVRNVDAVASIVDQVNVLKG